MQIQPVVAEFDTIPVETRDDGKRKKNIANSVQLQLQLPTGTELGKINININVFTSP